MKMIKQLMEMIRKGTKVYYVKGNQDELLQKFEGFSLEGFSIVNRCLLPLDDHHQAWIFHWDVFDVTIQHSKWLSKLGAVGYDILILPNRFIKLVSEGISGEGKDSLSKKIKNSVRGRFPSLAILNRLLFDTTLLFNNLFKELNLTRPA